MYGLDSEDLGAFIYSTFNVELTSQQVECIFEACKRLFVIRFLRDKHAAGSSIAQPRRIMLDGGDVKIGVKCLDRCKQLNGYDDRWTKIIECEEAFFQKLNGDFRDYINIHDLGDILAAVVRSLKRKSVAIESNFIAKHCAYVMLSSRNFGFPLFGELSRRLA